jgi:RNA polymerase primary sigma factor
MDYKFAREYFYRYLEEILQNYKRINDSNLLKLLLKYNLKAKGLEPKFPLELFKDIVSLDSNKRRYRLLNDNEPKKTELYGKIINLMKEELLKIGMNCNIAFWFLPEKMYFDKKGQALVLFKCNIEILSFDAIVKEDGVSYLLKNNKNSTYYLYTNKKYDWVGTYNQKEGKIFGSLEEIVEWIYLSNFSDVTIIKIKDDNAGKTKIIPAQSPAGTANDFYSENLCKLYGLYKWQREAYKKWLDNDRIGVIEAVTGSGKTLVAKYAIRIHLEKNYEILVIVPTVELQEQWYKVLLEFKNYGIHKIGGLKDFQNTTPGKIHIAVVHSASKFIFTPQNGKGLLIADECHHYGAEKFQKALNPYFARRMGLTSTYQRQDNGIEKYLNPFFKNVCYSFMYKEALEEDVIAHFNVAFIGIVMNAEEAFLYDEYEKKYKDAGDKLVKAGLKYHSFGEFIKKVTIAANDLSSSMEIKWLARTFLKYFNKKRALLANIAGKFEILKNADIQNIIKNANGTILFSQTKESAENAAGVLNEYNFCAKVVESGMEKMEVKNVLAVFETGETEIIAAPLLLDEGIDVPSADLAIVIASNRNKRQMIQRMGRILRKKPDHRKAKILVLYATGTSEDPELGAHEGFLEDITEVADAIGYFNQNNLNKIGDFLTPGA